MLHSLMNIPLLVLLLLFTTTANAAQSICATQNTGGSGTSTSSDYMSNGLCSDTCSAGGYALAIVQGKNCWCSNTAPSDSSSVSVSECSVDCPGYPEEQCGNEADSLFGYIEISTPSSTAADSSSGVAALSSTTSPSSSSTTESSSSTTSSSSSTSTSSTSTTHLSSSVIESSTVAVPSSTTTDTSSTTSSSTSTSTSTSSSSSSSTRSSSSSTSSQAPVTSIVYSIMTITGSAETQITTTQVVSTIISVPSQTSSTSSTSSSNNNKSTGFFDSPGKVAGVFVVVGLVILALIGALLWFFCLRHRKNGEDMDDDDDEEESVQSSVNHRDEKIVKTNKNNVPVPMMNPDEYHIGDDDFVEVDQRLDPRQMFMNWENGSRQSLADDMDYSRRVLRVTND